jgi:type IV secretory pathway protease TraF
VALKDPQDNTLVVKRIIALPGQSVYLHKGKVYVDGKLLNEPYLLTRTTPLAENSPARLSCQS